MGVTIGGENRLLLLIKTFSARVKDTISALLNAISARDGKSPPGISVFDIEPIYMFLRQADGSNAENNVLEKVPRIVMDSVVLRKHVIRGIRTFGSVVGEGQGKAKARPRQGQDKAKARPRQQEMLMILYFLMEVTINKVREIMVLETFRLMERISPQLGKHHAIIPLTTGENGIRGCRFTDKTCAKLCLYVVISAEGQEMLL